MGAAQDGLSVLDTPALHLRFIADAEAQPLLLSVVEVVGS